MPQDKFEAFRGGAGGDLDDGRRPAGQGYGVGSKLNVSLLFLLVPRLLSAQTSGSQSSATEQNRLHRFSLYVAAGSTLQGGDLQSVAIGYSPRPGLTLLVSGERNHRPTEIRRYENGFSATRGGTARVFSGELRLALLTSQRASAYTVVGMGLGGSQPNVNEIFRDSVSGNGLRVGFAGAGLSVPVYRSLSVFGDARFALAAERDVILSSLPIRGGVSWHF
jgi:hypothetical protein